MSIKYIIDDANKNPAEMSDVNIKNLFYKFITDETQNKVSRISNIIFYIKLELLILSKEERQELIDYLHGLK